MSSIVIAGDTSGSVTLQAPATAGTTVLTLPATSGTVITTASGTAATATNLAGGVAGAIPYQSGSGATGFSAAGTSGQLLQSNGVSAPTWITPSGSGLTLLSTVTASASATVDIETTFSSTYSAYLLVVSGLVISSAGEIRGQLKINGAYVATASTYIFHNAEVSSASASYAARARGTGAGFSWFEFASDVGNAAEKATNLIITITTPSSTTLNHRLSWTGSTAPNAADTIINVVGAASNTTTGALTGIRFSRDTGNFTSGTFRLYGLANS
jgi:hypothetical protein